MIQDTKQGYEKSLNENIEELIADIESIPVGPDRTIWQYRQHVLDTCRNYIDIEGTIYPVNDPNASWSLPK